LGKAVASKDAVKVFAIANQMARKVDQRLQIEHARKNRQ
jgi:hypothetical protein